MPGAEARQGGPQPALDRLFAAVNVVSLPRSANRRAMCGCISGSNTPLEKSSHWVVVFWATETMGGLVVRGGPVFLQARLFALIRPAEEAAWRDCRPPVSAYGSMRSSRSRALGLCSRLRNACPAAAARYSDRTASVYDPDLHLAFPGLGHVRLAALSVSHLACFGIPGLKGLCFPDAARCRGSTWADRIPWSFAAGLSCLSRKGPGLARRHGNAGCRRVS